MIDHVSVGVTELARSVAFYEAVLGTLGMTCLVRRESTAGFGKRYPELWLNHRPGMPAVEAATGIHLCLRARTEAAVRAFHAAALANGGTDDGAPGPRVAAMTGYFAAFIRDPDGNRLEAATFPVAPGV
jgi:catechol 2,3-dioxygenase-like lactoylglutathione lyase family enzyme